MVPEGWLRDPNGRWLLCFMRDPQSSQKLPQIYMDKWDTSPVGTPNRFVNRRKVGVTPAIETWDELINSGWIRITPRLDHVA